MTLATTTSRVSYAGNGTAGPFAYTWKVFSDSDLKVYVDDILKTKTTHYTVSGVGVAGGGNVTFTAGNFPAVSAEVVIYRDQPLVQETDLIANGQIPAESLETQLDKIVMQIQTIEERLKKVPMLAEGKKSTDLPITLANPVAGAPLLWDTTGKIVTAGTAIGGKVQVYRAGTNQTIVPGSNRIQLNSTASISYVDYLNTLNEFDNVTNFRFVPTVSGGFLVTANAVFVYIANAGRVFLYLTKTGAATIAAQHTSITNAPSSGRASVSAIVQLTTSDYLELWVNNETLGGNTEAVINVTKMEIVRLW